MKESNDYLETSYNSIECLNHKKELDTDELGRLMDLAGKDGAIKNSEISELTKIILSIDPVAVDESLQAKFNKIMNKVRAQYA